MTIGIGVQALVDGASLLRRSRIGIYLWPPALVSIVIIAAGLWVGYTWVERLGTYVEDWLPDWLDVLATLLVPVLYVLVTLLATWLFGFLAVILSSPLHGNLSAALEKALTGEPPEVMQSTWQMLARTVQREGRKLRYQLPRLAGVAVVSLVPVVNVLAVPLGFALAAWLLAIQFVDLPGENRSWPFERTLDLLRSNRSAALSFGACIAALLSIPLINVLAIPLAIAGGAVLWHRLEKADSREMQT